MSALIGLPFYVFCIMTDMFQSVPVLIASLLVSLACLYEFYKISDRGSHGGTPFMKSGLAAGVAVNLLMYVYAYGKIYGYSRYIPPFDAQFLMAIIVALTGSILALQIFQRPLKGGTYSLAVTLFGVILIPLFFSHIILMKSLANGAHYILVLNMVVMLNDAGAYFGGVSYGKHKVGFDVSPNKSWEGYYTGLFVSIVSMLIISEVYTSFLGLHLFTRIEAVIGGVLLSIVGSTGDLVESAIKRDAGVKDSGRLIPGHGGMWDAFDAVIFTLPFFYYYLLIKGVQ
jgi:phosphatidate cytidylyltransferase